MNRGLSDAEIRRKIQAGSEAWRDVIPSDQHARFVERVQSAVTIYFGLLRPKDLRAELEVFEKATQDYTAGIGDLVLGLSLAAREVLSR